MVAILCRFKSCYPHQAERHPIRVPFLFCAAGLLRRPGRAYPQFLRANCSPQAGCPADGAFSLSRLRVTGRGTSTVFACELLPAGWLPGRWGVFSVLDVCDRAGHIHNLCARIAPRRGEKNFSSRQNRPVSPERTLGRSVRQTWSAWDRADLFRGVLCED